jgi:hypothetical protein
MGCCLKNKSNGEAIIDAIFDSISGRDIVLMLQKLNDLRVNQGNGLLLETDFQVFTNEFLVSSQYQAELFDYWNVFYHSKPLNRQVVYVKFCLILMFKDSQTIKRAEEVLCTYREMVNKEKKEQQITVFDLTAILEDYVTAISLFTVESFKSVMDNPGQFRERYTCYWGRKVIKGFVKVTFFKPKDTVNTKYEIAKFLESHLKTLTDPAAIRKKLMNFALENYKDDLKLTYN